MNPGCPGSLPAGPDLAGSHPHGRTVTPASQCRMPAPRRPRLEEIPALALVLTRSFYDDPLFVYLFPDPVHRRDDLPAYFAWLLTDGADAGSSVTVLTQDLSSVIVWAPVGPSARASRRPSARPTWTSAADWSASRMPRATRGPPGLFFPYVAVMPGLQGEGRGTALMETLVANAERLRAPVRTGITVPRSVAFLERFGFEVTREIERTAAGPHRWQLTRPSS